MDVHVTHIIIHVHNFGSFIKNMYDVTGSSGYVTKWDDTFIPPRAWEQCAGSRVSSTRAACRAAWRAPGSASWCVPIAGCWTPRCCAPRRADSAGRRQRREWRTCGPSPARSLFLSARTRSSETCLIVHTDSLNALLYTVYQIHNMRQSGYRYR